MQEQSLIETLNVLDVQNDTALQFISNSQDIVPVNEQFNTDYDSFFIEIGDGDYTRVYGMYGIVPYLSNILYKVL